jgi:HEPN domain
MTAPALMAKARTACESARALLERKDCDGACNRAYYAMFDAARAALLATNAEVTLNSTLSDSKPIICRCHLIQCKPLFKITLLRIAMDMAASICQLHYRPCWLGLRAARNSFFPVFRIVPLLDTQC